MEHHLILILPALLLAVGAIHHLFYKGASSAWEKAREALKLRHMPKEECRWPLNMTGEVRHWPVRAYEHEKWTFDDRTSFTVVMVRLR